MVRRRNPHQEQAGFIGPNGIKRIARSGSSASAGHMKQAQPQLYRIERPQGYIMVVLHSKEGRLSSLDREVLYVARVLAGREPNIAVVAVAFGMLEEDLRNYGVDRLVANENSSPPAQLLCLQQLKERYAPQHILFGEGDLGDSDLARRLAVAENLSIATDVIEIDDKNLRRICDNGLRQGVNELTRIILLTSGVAETDFDFITEARSEPWQQEVPAATWKQSDYSLAAEKIPLEEAGFILAAGNGIAKMETFFELARQLGATVGGSRVVVDDGKLPRDSQIGATGKTVAAGVYVAIGISGAIQHLQGIKECGTVIAVNRDDSCDMVKRADLAVICDAEEWMQEMIRLAKEAGSEREERKAG